MYNDFCGRFINAKSGRLLDVGCGLGYFVKKISEYKNWEASGCEILKTAADFAREKLYLKNIYCGKLEEAEFGEAYFDIITMWDVIEHFPDPGAMLVSINRLLKPGGFLFIHILNIKIQLPKAKIKKIILGEKKNIHYLEVRDHINNYSMQTIKKFYKKKASKK